MNDQPDDTTSLLQKYFRLTHCDRFFADAAGRAPAVSEIMAYPDAEQRVAGV